MPNVVKKESKKNKPVHIVFHSRIVKDVYGPLVKLLIEKDKSLLNAASLAKSFNHKYSCSVSVQTMKDWLKILDVQPTVSWNLPSASTPETT